MKHFMKLIMFVACFMLGSMCYAVEDDIMTDDSINVTITVDDVDNLTKKYVPSKYLNAFFTFTECDTDEETIELRIQILAVGQWESGWKVTVGPKNKNGTRDLGYLALNSANVTDYWFMSHFGLKEDDNFEIDENDPNELYLIACIKYYKYLYRRHGEDALYCYNCGERRYMSNKIPSSSIAYKKMVMKYINKFNDDVLDIAENRVRFEEELENMIDSVVASTTPEMYQILYQILHQNKMQSVNSQGMLYIFFGEYIEVYMLYDNKNKRAINDALRCAGLPNPEFECIGYIMKYGSRVAPVFQSRITGERVIC